MASPLIPLKPNHPAMIAERERSSWSSLAPAPIGYAVRGVDAETGAAIEFRTMAASAPEALRNAELAGVVIDPRDPALVAPLSTPRVRVFAPVLAAVLLGALILTLVQIIAAIALGLISSH